MSWNSRCGQLRETLKNKKNKEVGFVYTVVSKGFYLNKFFYAICPYLYAKLTNFCNIFDKFISTNRLLLIVSKFFVNISAWIEKNIFEMSGKVVMYCMKFASIETELVQTRNVQTYLAYGVLIVVSILVTILLTYMFIINNLGGVK